MKVLVVEDDKYTLAGLVEILEAEGYEAIAAADGKEALALFAKESPDFVCLDIMLPEVDGYDLCRKIRGKDTEIPILFISAKSEEIDKVIGLELGADDFITKPFGVKEVIARIRAVSRRCLRGKKAGESHAPFVVGDLEVSPRELRARRGNKTIDLSLRDIKILALFYENKGKVVDRDTIFDRCWGIDYMPNSRTLDQHISQLRKRVEIDPNKPVIIRTVHGAGYRYDG